jgi:hypothetical protein
VKEKSDEEKKGVGVGERDGGSGEKKDNNAARDEEAFQNLRGLIVECEKRATLRGSTSSESDPCPSLPSFPLPHLPIFLQRTHSAAIRNANRVCQRSSVQVMSSEEEGDEGRRT